MDHGAGRLRAFGYLFSALIVLTLAQVASGQIISLPAQVQFPAVAFANPYGYPQSSSATITLFNSGESEVSIVAFRFSSNVFSTKAGVPLTLNRGTSKQITLDFNPSTSDQFSGNLQAIGSRNVVLVTVALFGVADCWSPMSCEPKGPICRINKSNESWQPFAVPNFFQIVSPAIDEQAGLHAKGVDYDLPVDFILKISGLAGVLQITPPLSCDDKNIHFTRIPKSRLRARFQRNASTDTAADGTLGGYTIHVSIPKDVSGITVVGGGFSEFHFDKTKEPTLLLKYGAQVIFDDAMKCVNATFGGSTLRPLTSPTPLPIEVR